MPEIRKGSCLFCSLQCGFGLEVDDGAPVRIDFDEEAPVNRGALCARGHYNIELLLHPKRFLAATVNRRRVPWVTAVSRIAGKLSSIKEENGGAAIGVIVGTELSNEDYEKAVSFATDVVGTSNLAVAYDGNDFPFLAGGGAGNASPEDLDDADCFVLIGDVFWGHPCIAKRIIEARHASRSNAIYTLNPYRTNTDWFADLHIRTTPDAEPLALAAILTALRAQGVPKIAPAKAAEATGLAASEIEALAADLKERKKVVVVASSRLGDSTAAYLTAGLAAKLAAAVGGKYAPLFRGGNAIGAFRRVSSKRTVPEILGDVADGKIKGLLVFGPDILQLYPGAVSTDDLEALGLLAASAVFENDTTKHGDVALPQAVWTERDGSYTPSFGGETSVEALVAPQGDARMVGEMLGALARELGGEVRTGGAEATHELPEIDAAAALDAIASRKAPDGLALIEGVSPLHRWDGTITGRMTFPQRQRPYCEVWIGEQSAAALGVEPGANVTVTSGRGETRIIATVTDRMPGSLVAIPTYVPDARGLFVWTPNPATRWYDVRASEVKVTSES